MVNPQAKETRMSKSKIKTTFICFLQYQGYHPLWICARRDILRADVGKAYWCCEAQARRVVERSLIDSLAWQRAGTLFASSVAVFSRKKAPLPCIIRRTLLTSVQLTSCCFQNSKSTLKQSACRTLRTLNHFDIFLFRFLRTVLNNGRNAGKNCKEFEGD
jgi:hypothetical protein